MASNLSESDWSNQSRSLVLTTWALLVVFGGSASRAAEFDCNQLREIGYLRMRSGKLKSDPGLEERVNRLIEDDLREKVERQPELAKCQEKPRAQRIASKAVESAGSGVAGSYVFAGVFLAMWSILAFH